MPSQTRIRAVDAASDISLAFAMAKDFLITDAAVDTYAHLPAAKQSAAWDRDRKEVDEAGSRVNKFLAQCQADQERLETALAALREIAKDRPADPLEWGEASTYGNADDAEANGYNIAHRAFGIIAEAAIAKIEAEK